MKLSYKVFGLATTVVSMGATVAISAIIPSLATEKMGPTYPVVEKDAIETITNKLKEAQAQGKLQELEKEALQRADQYLMSPTPVTGIHQVEQANIRYFDPTWILDQDLFDDNGNRIASKGTRVNPLDVMPVTKQMFFFDGRDDRQIAKASELAEKYGITFVPILVAGSWVETSKKMNQAVYFDQQGRLSERLTINSVPALVTQEGKLMRIEEMKP